MQNATFEDGVVLTGDFQTAPPVVPFVVGFLLNTSGSADLGAIDVGVPPMVWTFADVTEIGVSMVGMSQTSDYWCVLGNDPGFCSASFAMVIYFQRPLPTAGAQDAITTESAIIETSASAFYQINPGGTVQATPEPSSAIPVSAMLLTLAFMANRRGHLAAGAKGRGATHADR